MADFERVTFGLTYGCGCIKSESLPIGGGTARQIALLRQGAKTKLCARCFQRNAEAVANGRGTWADRY